jgi:serine/threonine protein kinase/TolB-like protein/Tfp pilus assembly protein PilF
MIGKAILHYKILDKLGEGGMGVVYKAEDTKLHRQVALKFLPASLTSDGEAKERFIQEARAASALDHPNVCTIHEINETEDGQMFIAMACYEGMTLSDKIAKEQIPIDEIIDIAIQITSGLVKAHQQSIIHRDIKPANIVVTEDGLVKILDFGIAKLIKGSRLTGEVLNIGTVAHISPEQIKGDKVDHRTDIWSLGVVMYEMIARQLPFKGEYDQAIIYSIINEVPEPLTKIRHDVSTTLDSVVMKALSKNPDERYQSADELLKELINCKDSNNQTDSTTAKTGGQRKLAAIMFTDMVGYSALAQENESLAIELLEVHRQLLRPIFARHSGKEIEAIGDAFFVEFSSALGSVICAIEIQKKMFERNQKVESKRRIQLRIGLHVGDVIHIGKHVHGDGVNIAARLEPLSAAGGICLSEDVARQIHNKIDLPLTKLGVKNLKNIKAPIEIFSIVLPWEKKNQSLKKIISLRSSTKRNIISFILVIIAVLAVLLIQNIFDDLPTGAKNNRIAVLPLVNISQDNENDYFAEGMTEELISQLAKISGLSVIARTSVMKYKNTQMNIKEIGRELDVGTILEGSVRKTSDKARITIQLIDVETQEHLWVEDYDRELKNIFEMQSEIALRIANELKVQLLSTEKQQIEKRNTENAEAFRSYLMGKYQLNNRTPESLKNALKYFNTAISLDPNYALAYVGLTDCYTLISGAAYGYIPREDAIQKANDAIRKAIEIDPTSAEAYNSLAYLKFRLEWDWEEAENYFKKAIELKPGYSSAYERYALYLALLGRNKESIQLMNHAYELDPLNPSVSTGVGRMYHFARQFDKAIKQYEETLQMNPDYVETVFALGMSNSVLENYDRAIQQLKRAIELSNGRLIIITFLARTYAAAGMIEEAKKLQEELIQLQSEKNVSPFHFAVIDAALGNEDAAIDSLYKAYDEHFGILVYLKASPLFEKLFDHPRFYELLRKIGLEK